MVRYRGSRPVTAASGACRTSGTSAPRKSGQSGRAVAVWAPAEIGAMGAAGDPDQAGRDPRGFNAVSMATDPSNGTDSSASPWISRVGGAFGDT
jgi:hypothetical protein